jgi:hypothetical protein
MFCYTSQKFVTFITTLLLPDHYQSPLHSPKMCVTPYSLLPDHYKSQVAITFITNILLPLTKRFVTSPLHSLQIFCYPLPEVCYESITFVINGPLQVTITFTRNVCYTLQKFVTRSLLQVAITFITNALLHLTEVHYQSITFIMLLLDRYKSLLHSLQVVCPYKSSLPVHYIYYKLVLTGPIQVAIIFTMNSLLHLTKVGYHSITLITKSLLPDHYKSPLH